MCIEWINGIFGECITSSLEQTSFYVGFMSLCCYAVALLPQFYHNYTRKNVDGLSFGLLGIWLLGDISNLSGTILTQQLPIQKYIAMYFLSMDVFIILQYTWYSKFYPKLNDIHHDDSDEDTLEEEDEETPLIISSSPILQKNFVSIVVFLGCMTAVLGEPTGYFRSPSLILGYILAWMSGLFYFTSRIPQILENYRLKSLKGLSIFLFICTISGNLFYGLSILLRQPALDEKFYFATFPYLVGSMGVLVFDFIILGQYYLYNR
jgi:uncharacterized protein with PQ loop repeat